MTQSDKSSSAMVLFEIDTPPNVSLNADGGAHRGNRLVKNRRSKVINATRIIGILYEALERPFRIDSDWIERVMDKISIEDPELVVLLKAKAIEIREELKIKRSKSYEPSIF